MVQSLKWIVVFVAGFLAATALAMFHFNLFPAWSVRMAQPGKLEGKLVVQWLEPDKFLFVPDSAAPLRFTRSTGEVIQPQKLMTDGGSVPRAMWVARSYSPWGYAPAFIIHDWLFEMKRCAMPNNPATSHRVAADIMAEVMKTMAAAGVVSLDDLTLLSMHAAVNSSVARDYWETGTCTSQTIAAAAERKAAPGAPAPKMAPAPQVRARSALEQRSPVMQYEIRF
ncbi:MAG TPA: DUF1353 domain-containing protein [Hyphomicrobiaceae bacterium]|nr:DUF1353 domain-containing protein [Hyphomicrobiaceae bacterium]